MLVIHRLEELAQDHGLCEVAQSAAGADEALEGGLHNTRCSGIADTLILAVALFWIWPYIFEALHFKDGYNLCHWRAQIWTLSCLTSKYSGNSDKDPPRKGQPLIKDIMTTF